MTQQHPITPPEELYAQWCSCGNVTEALNRAVQWGADQELEACCEWIPKWTPWDAEQLRAARRPKLPSLKEQARQALGRFSANAHTTADQMQADFDTIRRALEQLDN